ncbi:hypothetical protein [Actinophytocola sp. NPDC049390]|uniref:hypothetical protein n=1 Tax=Actinophytocola sp. NPDC049390 TaxID=3363894 RepID=UPI0037A1347E
MTDDITRGLTLLADEVPPAPVDTVVEKARARTRNRRAAAASALAVIAAGTLAISFGSDVRARVAEPSADRAERLTQQMAEIRGDVTPVGWRLLPAGTPGPLDAELAGGTPFSFACRTGREPVCQAIGQYAHGEDRLSVAIQVFSGNGISTMGKDTEIMTLPDGTRAAVYSPEHMIMVTYGDVLRADPAAYLPRRAQLLSALRPGRTGVLVNVAYTGAEPPFTDAQLLTFATAFTY